MGSERPAGKLYRQKFFVALGAAAVAAGSHFVDGAASAILLSLATYLAGWLTRWPERRPTDDRSSTTPSEPPPPAERAADARARHDGGKSGGPFGH